MYVETKHKDVACVYGWYLPKDYAKWEVPKIPLMIATLVQSQINMYKDILLREGWREVGWYPGCHYELDDPNGYKVALYIKEQDVPLIEKPKPHLMWGKTEPFNTYVPLGCSCLSYKTRPKMTRVLDRHRGLGVHRMTKPTKSMHYNNWHRFATTSLASYWFWGLLPDESDVHKFEK